MKTLAHVIARSAKQYWADLTGQCLVVLDFDRTLFDTAQYYADFLEMIAGLYGANTAEDLGTAEKNSQNFDPFAYLLEKGITYDTLTSQFDAFVGQKYPRGNSYLFPGATELARHLGRRRRTHSIIITTGSLPYQQFKLRLAPELSELPHQIIGDNKGEILQKQFSQASAVEFNHRRYSRFILVDDKASALTPIAPHRRYVLIHLLRPGAKNQDRSGRHDIIEITDLERVRELIQ